MRSARPVTALVLSGGGARAAYQAGVLQALARLRREAGAADQGNPFRVICGTSAGAINAAALATRIDDFDAAVAALHEVWRHFHAAQVYRVDAAGLAGSGARWLGAMAFGWLLRRLSPPRALLDNRPLGALLQAAVPLDRLPRLLAQGTLDALAITASGYGSGEHVTFYQCADPAARPPWRRHQRVAQPATIDHGHLLASSAIPFVFPATELVRGDRREWFGDGSMRQMAPLSPAIHLGADRLLVIGAGRMQEPIRHTPRHEAYPSLAQVAGHALSGIFLDALAVDIERLDRINRTLALLSPAQRAGTPLRPVQALVIAPSQRLDDLAARHLHDLPRAMRLMLGAMGVQPGRGRRPARGTALASYLLFEARYTRALIALGEADTLARRDEVLAFFGWGASAEAPPPAGDAGDAGASPAVAQAAAVAA